MEQATREAIAEWTALPSPQLRDPLVKQKWLVVDVETTGLDMRRDQLLAIGAVVVDGGAIRLEHSFEVVLQQASPSGNDNILIHRITGSDQMAGMPPQRALAAFLAFAGKLPCVAFHAAFDKTMLQRAFAASLEIEFPSPFLDLALLAPAILHDAPHGLHALDDWTDHFSISIAERHRAVSDAMGTAQLMQHLLAVAARQNIATAEQLFRLARHQHWLAGARRR